MATPKERRAQREAEKQEKWAVERQKTLDNLGLMQTPSTLAQAPEKQPRLAPHLERHATKEPKAVADFDRHAQRMTWCHTKSDQVGQWTWGELRAWTVEEWDGTILPSLNHLKNSTWEEIEQMSAPGKKNRRLRSHHWHDLIDLVEEAQQRWIEVGLEQFDTVFRFRIGGQRRRAWGYVVQAHFHLVWWDRMHKIFPTDK